MVEHLPPRSGAFPIPRCSQKIGRSPNASCFLKWGLRWSLILADIYSFLVQPMCRARPNSLSSFCNWGCWSALLGASGPYGWWVQCWRLILLCAGIVTVLVTSLQSAGNSQSSNFCWASRYVFGSFRSELLLAFCARVSWVTLGLCASQVSPVCFLNVSLLLAVCQVPPRDGQMPQKFAVSQISSLALLKLQDASRWVPDASKELTDASRRSLVASQMASDASRRLLHRSSSRCY